MTQQGLCFCIAGLLEAVLLVELVHAAAGVDELLLAGVEGVALGADFNRDVLLGGTGLNHVAAGAANRGRLIIGMNAFFHVFISSFQSALSIPSRYRYRAQMWLSDSRPDQICFWALILTPGPMVEAVTQERMYWPLAAAGLALMMAPMRAA